MIAVEYDWDLAPLQRPIAEELRRIIPACDPDGRGRVDVRVDAHDAGGVRVEVCCGSPRIRAIAVDLDPVIAIRRAFACVREALGEPDADYAVSPGSRPTS